MNIVEAAKKVEEWSGETCAPDTLYNYFQRRTPHLPRAIIVSGGRRVADIDERDLREWHEKMEDREPKGPRAWSLTPEELEALKEQRRLRSAARVKQQDGQDFIYDSSNRKVVLPEKEPSDFEFKMLMLFDTITRSPGTRVFARDGRSFVHYYPSQVLERAAERAALCRLANKGWLSRLEPELDAYRINEAGRWFLKTFESDDEE